MLWQGLGVDHIPAMDAEPETLLFEAVIVPHRSLSPRALRRLMVAIGIAICASTTVSLLLHAWPVTGFAGAELLLAVYLLRLNARRAESTEVVLLTSAGLRIRRAARGGAAQVLDLPSSWLRVSLEELPGRVPRLFLRARDMEEEIATSLGEDEKRDLAAALREAVHRWKHPVFDNPQTRDEAKG
jgi:uncharacterized membrane protein